MQIVLICTFAQAAGSRVVEVDAQEAVLGILRPAMSFALTGSLIGVV
jgi:hypothetical protein